MRFYCYHFDSCQWKITALQVVEVVRDGQQEVRPSSLRWRTEDLLQRGQIVEASLMLKQKK